MLRYIFKREFQKSPEMVIFCFGFNWLWSERIKFPYNTN